MRRAGAAVLAAMAMTGTAQAAPVAPPAVKSDNVTWRATLDEPLAISARFSRGHMFLSTLRGLSVYDVRDPRAPRKVGSLDLPHFENEDVDLHGDVLLISNDPAEGQGVLFTIDISDPAAPKVLGSVDTGNAADGLGHTASCIQACRFAYLAGGPNGIDVYDLTDPKAPKKAANAPVREVSGGVATHDVQVDRSGLAWIAGFGGTAAYDTTNPLKPRLVARTDDSAKSTYISELGLGDGKGLNDFVHHNSLRVPDAEGRDSDVVLVTEEDYTRPGCNGAGSFQSWRIGPDRVLRNLDQWSVEPDRTKGRVFCSAHYFDERDGLVAQGFYEQGVRLLDVGDPADIRQVGYWIPDGTEMWGALYPPSDPTGRVVYALDTVRGVDVLEVDRERATATLPPPPKRLPVGEAASFRSALKQAAAVANGGRLSTTRPAFAGLCRLRAL
jgi:hypothetical protein